MVLLVILGCMGCCCAGVPLFGLWPRLDSEPVEAALRGQPIIVDHACAPSVVCERVEDLQATVHPLSYGLFSGEITALVEVRATCREPRREGSRIGPAVVCAGTLGAVYATADDGWALRFVTESTAGMPSSGLPYEGGGGDWDD